MADITETTQTIREKQNANLNPFKPGQSGNPNGRPRGSRHILSETFLKALLADFNEHGEKAISDVREKDSPTYLRVIASCINKLPDQEQRDDAVGRILAAIPDGQLVTFIEGVRLLAVTCRSGEGADQEGIADEPSGIH